MKIRPGLIEEVVDLARRMPDFNDPHGLISDPDQELPQLDHILVAEEHGAVVGFRAGYRYSPDTFAIWLAGVLPDFRRRGIARALYREQKDWLREQGYTYLRTHVRNYNRVMLEVLVRNGYDIVDLIKDEDSVSEHRIVFLKRLGGTTAP